MEQNLSSSQGGPTRIVGGHRGGHDAGSAADLLIVDGLIDKLDAVDAAGLRGTTIDAAGLTVAPGYIDLQINGGYGFDLVSDPATMWQLGRELPRHGVTSFLATIITSPPATTDSAIRALATRPDQYVGAEPLGLHFEGPILSPQRPGAHPPQHLATANQAVITSWTRASGVRLVTIAPELDNASAIIAELAHRGVTVSAGHTESDADHAEAGLQAGMTMVTHLFNAMAPLGHRSPNLVGVALADPRLTVGLIADGVHVDPLIVKATWNAKGPHGIVLVTDAVAPMGLGPGRYEFARHAITADEQAVRNDAGTLAGSILTLDQAVRNLRRFTGCSPDDALMTVTATPAALIGEEDRGQLNVGSVADIVLLDKNLEVQVTICAGQVVYVADESKNRVSFSESPLP